MSACKQLRPYFSPIALKSPTRYSISDISISFGMKYTEFKKFSNLFDLFENIDLKLESIAGSGIRQL